MTNISKFLFCWLFSINFFVILINVNDLILFFRKKVSTFGVRNDLTKGTSGKEWR